ncbi:MAG: PAS domain-containing protein [Chloroflexota bacterium]
MKKKQGKPADATAPPAGSYSPNVSTGRQELRRQAEAKLKVKPKGKASPVTGAVETQRLLHELQVHQIELEMQNDELVQSKAELEFTLSLYAELYAFAPVGYFTLTRDGTIRRANLSGAKLMGLGLSDLIKKRFGTFVSLSARTTFSDFLDQVFTSDKKESCEVTLNKDGPAPFWVLIEAVVENSGGENELCYAIVSDICERKQAEAELRHQSTHDILTGLYNYGFFMEELVRLERGRQFPVSIVMADVDHLKEVNRHYPK